MKSFAKNLILFRSASAHVLFREIDCLPGDHVLLVNAANGELAKQLKEKYGSAIHLVCTERNAHLRDLLAKTLEADIRPFSQLPFPARSFNRIILPITLEGIDDRKKYLEHIAALLRPKGTVYITTYQPRGLLWYFKEWDWRLFEKEWFGKIDRKDIQSLCTAAGLKLLRSKNAPLIHKQEVCYAKAVKV